MIPQDVIDRLQELNIEKVATKLGMDVKKHKALCFMHNDHTPSLRFSATKNMFFCFVLVGKELTAAGTDGAGYLLECFNGRITAYHVCERSAL